MDKNKKARVIAFYLPQFHPIQENDIWWGKGFTEWTNVGKAKPLFRGHHQPRVPADLGYYDLRLPEVRQEQANMAAEAGIEGFCYWHYWFGNGKQLLEKPFNEVLESGTPDFPFCLGWANESWMAKQWNKDTLKDKTLIEQLYPGQEDRVMHFNYVLKAIKDHRYIQIDERPVFLIHRPELVPNLKEFVTHWNQMAKDNGFLNGFYFIGRYTNHTNYNTFLAEGMDAVTTCRNNAGYLVPSKYRQFLLSIKNICLRRPIRTIDYPQIIDNLSKKEEDSKENFFPSILPGWDHSPRSGNKGTILHGSTPESFAKHVKQVLEIVKDKNPEHRVVFLKSWNEWAEGNYMEPDIKYGRGFLDALKEAVSDETGK
jgi:lipopolysaccharide biosynthesis protein